MSNTVKAKKDNGDRQVFSRLVWDNLPGDKYGWKEDNTPHEVPDEIKTALIMLVAHLYENRAAVTDKQAFDMPMGVEYLLADHRVIGFA